MKCIVTLCYYFALSLKVEAVMLFKELILSNEERNKKRVNILTLQMFCQNPRVFFVSNDTHASNVVRVVEATRNLESFAETFECSEADFMGPEFRCDMWNH